jgi:hypothetical protein
LQSLLTRSNFSEIEASEFFDSHRDYHYQCHLETGGEPEVKAE